MMAKWKQQAYGQKRPDIRNQEPPIGTQKAPIEERSRFWPDDKPVPETFRRHTVYPCPECRRVRLDNGGQAVVVRCLSDEFAYLTCRGCGHQWKLEIK